MRMSKEKIPTIVLLLLATVVYGAVNQIQGQRSRRAELLKRLNAHEPQLVRNLLETKRIVELSNKLVGQKELPPPALLDKLNANLDEAFRLIREAEHACKQVEKGASHLWDRADVDNEVAQMRETLATHRQNTTTRCRELVMVGQISQIERLAQRLFEEGQAVQDLFGTLEVRRPGQALPPELHQSYKERNESATKLMNEVKTGCQQIEAAAQQKFKDENDKPQDLLLPANKRELQEARATLERSAKELGDNMTRVTQFYNRRAANR